MSQESCLGLFHIQTGWVWVLIFIVLATILWPLSVLLVSIPFGQYPFFIKYIRKVGRRFGIGKSTSVSSSTAINIAIFASGAGSNARKIIETFHDDVTVHIALIISNNPKAGVLEIARAASIPTIVVDKEKFFHGDGYVELLKEHKIDLIVLAGFLWKLPVSLIRAFPEKIINIHPALLPKFGGKGMYGHYVHQAVIDQKEKESGISIHYVDELYDHGPVIFQAKCQVTKDDTPESLAEKIHALEHLHYPVVIRKLIRENFSK